MTDRPSAARAATAGFEQGALFTVPVLAAHKWRTNGHLIRDAARLYIPDGATVLDPTWGHGRWWTEYRPTHLIRHDLHTLDGVDFRHLPEDDSTVDVVAFDPPYIAPGGRTTTGLPDLHNRYGIDQAASSPAEQHATNRGGLAEAHRVLRPGGTLITKCQDYTSSGTFQPVTHWTIVDGLDLGFELVDRFEHIGAPRPQPGGREQRHARRNLSTLLVFRKASR